MSSTLSFWLAIGYVHQKPYTSSLIAIQYDQLSGWTRMQVVWIGAANVFVTTEFLSTFAWYICENVKDNTNVTQCDH